MYTNFLEKNGHVQNWEEAGGAKNRILDGPQGPTQLDIEDMISMWNSSLTCVLRMIESLSQSHPFPWISVNELTLPLSDKFLFTPLHWLQCKF